MNLIVGLGNPGRSYVNNRHNVGFRCVDYFARKQGISLNLRRARSQLGTGEVGGTRVVLAKPRTFMNLSGEAVAALCCVRHPGPFFLGLGGGGGGPAPPPPPPPHQRPDCHL